ncbi:hypothetical protein RFI_29636 [Reticulomyxa filosa]|uniref:Kelch motif family protein n=1 Tax=Reticulomyxa filosa TaxID=46433 RepID=X6M1J1_RETFI|nr:hypothetical protein RFI_29636 [Reticulomyxa filosa]|eukprot:ETO07754.1 hypothetical protein RFI_29636 [Reticulomyxa filosa]
MKRINQKNLINSTNQTITMNVIIGSDHGDYQGARALIGGINNHLLFITYPKSNISVFDLNTFQYIKHATLPTNNSIWDHCFVSNSENGQVQGMIKTNQQNYQMLLFGRETGLSIEYDEDNNAFQFQKLPVCDDIAPFYQYASVCINDIILFFGGYSSYLISKSVYKYSIRENKWTTFQNTLTSPLCRCVAILSEEDNDIHIIGGIGDMDTKLSIHMKTKVRVWDPSQLVMICLFIYFEEIQINYFIIKYWIRTSKIKLGWIDEFDKIIIKYSGRNIYKLSHL